MKTTENLYICRTINGFCQFNLSSIVNISIGSLPGTDICSVELIVAGQTILPTMQVKTDEESLNLQMSTGEAQRLFHTLIELRQHHQPKTMPSLPIQNKIREAIAATGIDPDDYYSNITGETLSFLTQIETKDLSEISATEARSLARLFPSTTIAYWIKLDTATVIARECDAIKAMLLSKNKLYGNSALSPVRIFSQADPIEQIKVRIDDKLSRLASGQLDDVEDVVADLIGYLVLLRVAIANQSQPF
jgi:hypothetical protein